MKSLSKCSVSHIVQINDVWDTEIPADIHTRPEGDFKCLITAAENSLQLCSENTCLFLHNVSEINFCQVFCKGKCVFEVHWLLTMFFTQDTTGKQGKHVSNISQHTSPADWLLLIAQFSDINT